MLLKNIDTVLYHYDKIQPCFVQYSMTPTLPVWFLHLCYYIPQEGQDSNRGKLGRQKIMLEKLYDAILQVLLEDMKMI